MPFEQFAESQIPAVNWPEATLENPKDLIYDTSEHHAIFNLFYHLALAHLGMKKAKGVENFPGKYWHKDGKDLCI